MPVQTLAFACACTCQTCSRFHTRLVGRGWIGAYLGFPIFFHPVTGNPVDEGMRFLSYYQKNNEQPSLGFNASEFTRAWSIEADKYGQPTTSGIAGTELGAVRIPKDMIGDPGEYEFSQTQFAPWVLDSFTPTDDQTYVISTREEFTLSGKSVSIERVYRDWFSPAIMLEDVLEREMEQPEPSFEDLVVHTAPHFPQLTGENPNVLGEGAGGWVDNCNLYTHAFLLAVNFPGHAMKVIAPEDNAFYGACWLKRSTIYVPGNHRITEHDYPQFIFGTTGHPYPGPILNSYDITIPSGSQHVLEPPTTNNRFLVWHENEGTP